jgi:hypothetical protein
MLEWLRTKKVIEVFENSCNVSSHVIVPLGNARTPHLAIGSSSGDIFR